MYFLFKPVPKAVLILFARKLRLQLLFFFCLEDPVILFVTNIASIESTVAHSSSTVLKFNLHGRCSVRHAIKLSEYVLSMLEAAMTCWF